MKGLFRRLSLVALSLVASSARGNDSSFGGSGADLEPLKETRLRMASEDILLELLDDPVAAVER